MAAIITLHCCMMTSDVHQALCLQFDNTVHMRSLLSPAGAVGPGTGDIAMPPVRPSVTFSFRTVTQKRIAVFSRNFAGMCTKSWGCAV